MYLKKITQILDLIGLFFFSVILEVFDLYET